MDAKYTIKERIEYVGTRHSKRRHYAVYRENDDKCIAWDCPKTMAQKFILASTGMLNANAVLVSLRKKASNGADILAGIAADSLAKELVLLINK